MYDTVGGLGVGMQVIPAVARQLTDTVAAVAPGCSPCQSWSGAAAAPAPAADARFAEQLPCCYAAAAEADAPSASAQLLHQLLAANTHCSMSSMKQVKRDDTLCLMCLVVRLLESSIDNNTVNICGILAINRDH